jgi:hypothetical protein
LADISNIGDTDFVAEVKNCGKFLASLVAHIASCQPKAAPFFPFKIRMPCIRAKPVPTALTDPDSPLRRERSANNPIGYRHLEIIVAFDALNRLTTTLSDSSKGSNMNFLFNFTGWAFHRHHDILLVGHNWYDEAYHDPGATLC